MQATEELLAAAGGRQHELTAAAPPVNVSASATSPRTLLPVVTSGCLTDCLPPVLACSRSEGIIRPAEALASAGNRLAGAG